MRPEERTLRVGQSFAPRAVSSTCGGAKQESIQAEWHTTEHHVLGIDPQTGRITAIGVGSAIVTATEPGGPGWLGSITVHVKR